MDAAYSQANVKLVGVSSGVAYGELGPTHHSIEDVAWTRAIADLTVVVPSDPIDTAGGHPRWPTPPMGPIFIRTSRMPVPDRPRARPRASRFGVAATLREGTDVTLIANGVLVHRALAAADAAGRRGHLRAGAGHGHREPHRHRGDRGGRAGDRAASSRPRSTPSRGGLGGAVAEVVVTHHPVPMRILGFPGVFAPTGSAEFLLEHFGLDAAGIRAAARSILDGGARP